MMDIVVPLRRIVKRLAVGATGEPSGLVLLILQDKMHMAVARLGAHAFGQLIQHMLRAVVDDRMHGVEPQPVQMELLDPIERVLDDELAHRLRVLAVVIDGVAPGRLMALGEEAPARRQRGSSPRDQSDYRPRRGGPSARADGRPRSAP